MGRCDAWKKVCGRTSAKAPVDQSFAASPPGAGVHELAALSNHRKVFGKERVYADEAVLLRSKLSEEASRRERFRIDA